MNPKSGTARSAIAPLDPLQATKAIIASPGELQKARPNGAKKLATKLAASKVKGKGPVLVAAKAPQSPPSTKPCTVLNLDVSCSHGRKPGNGPSGLLLQVVPSRVVVIKTKVPIGGFEVSSGGSDKLTAKATYKSACGSAHPEINVSGNDCVSKHAVAHVENAVPPVHVPFWPSNIEPTRYQISANGCNGVAQQIYVECFPPQIISANFDGKEWSKRLDPMRSIAYEIVNALNGDDGFQIRYLEGKISGEWGWKEFKDHRAYFGFDLTLGMTPFIGIDQARLKVSVAQWVPPPIRAYSADVFAFLGFAGDVSLNLFWKKEGPDPSNETFGGCAKAKVEVSLGIEASAGAKNIIQVTITAQIKCDITVAGSAIYEQSAGPGLSASVERGDLAGELVCKTKGGGVFQWVDSESSVGIVFCPKHELWSGEKIWFLHEADAGA